jgi:RNA polymerase sigma factor (sigma-70 family)
MQNIRVWSGKLVFSPKVKGATVEKWHLTETAFNKLLAALADDREQAGEKYLLLKKNLTRFFSARGFASPDDASDEVLNRLARKLDGGEQIENVNTYALGIARLVALELCKSPELKTSNELPEIAVHADGEKTERERELSCLDKCLNGLSNDKKEIIVGYYQGERREKIENRQRIADALGIPNNALRSRAVRLREKLETCIRGCIENENF